LHVRPGGKLLHRLAQLLAGPLDLRLQLTKVIGGPRYTAGYRGRLLCAIVRRGLGRKLAARCLRRTSGLLCGSSCSLAGGHRRALSLTTFTSVLMLATAWPGMGGVDFCRRPFPSKADIAATANRAAPTISAASHADTTPLIAMIAHAMRQPTPYSA